MSYLNQNSKRAVICLSHQLDEKNNLSLDSIKRLRKSFQVFNENSCESFITTGWKIKKDLQKPLSSIMADYVVKNSNISRDSIFEETNAKDTVGEAVFIKKNFFLTHNDFNKIYVITSDWHLNRAKEIFEFVFGDKDDPVLHFKKVSGEFKCKVMEDSNTSIIKFREMVDSCKRGNIEEIYSKMLHEHTLYKK
tara:strand:- start:27967 stop:28545 length:579 start_codon:yes stop_codon:yes gene_type:complete